MPIDFRVERRDSPRTRMSSKRTPAPGFILVKLTLDILGIGLIVPILPKLAKEFSGGDTAALLAAVKALRVHETEA